MSRASLFPTVTKEERPKLLVAMAAFACVASAAVVARSAGTAIFLSSFPPTLLTYVYAAGAAAVMAASLTLGALATRVPLARLIAASSAVLVVCTLLVRFALVNGWPGAAVGAYLVGDLTARVPLILFWSYAALTFDPRQARRLYVLVGVAGTVACIAAGAAVRPLTTYLGIQSLLFLTMALGALFAVVIVRASSRRGPGASGRPPARTPSAVSSLRNPGLLAMPQVRFLALLAGATAVTLLTTDYLFLSAARARYQGPALAGFLGTYFSAAGVGTLLVQLFVVHQLLHRAGVLPALLVLPCTLLPLSIAVAIAEGAGLGSAFGWTVAAKLAEPVFDYTLNAAAVQMLYLGIRKQSRSQARTLVEGFARPLAVIVAALVLVTLVKRLDRAHLAAVVTAGSAVWLAAAVLSHRSYVSGLLASIGARRLDLEDESVGFGDRLIAHGVRESLRKATDEEARYVVGVLRSLPPEEDVRGDYRQLLARHDAELKATALQALAERGDASDVPAIRACLSHEAPPVRRAAVLALAARAGAASEEPLREKLRDPDAEVRAASMAALFGVGGLDAHVDACFSLKMMLDDVDPAARAAASRALSRIQLQGLGKALAPLLSDPDRSVRLAALQTCAARPSAELTPLVLEQLAQPGLAAAAHEALAALGDEVLPYLESFPERARAEQGDEALLRMPAVLARTRSPRALGILARALDAGSLRLRVRVIAAYCELARACNEVPARRSEIVSAALEQIAAACESDVALRGLAASGGARDLDLVVHALREERDVLLHNTLMLVGLLHPSVETRTLLWALTEAPAEKRAEAIEVLDNVLDGTLKRELLALLEPSARAAQGSFEAASVLRGLLDRHRSEWVVAGAAYSAGHRGMTESLPAVRARLEHPSPIVREAALDALSRLGGEAEVQSACERLRGDVAAEVRALVSRLAGREAGEPPPPAEGTVA